MNKLNSILRLDLAQIDTNGGRVCHMIKKADRGYCGFGELYGSIIQGGNVRAWKRHNSMTLNLMVPIGLVRFVFTLDGKTFRSENIGSSTYARLTVPPGIWFGFCGLHDGESLILNFADIEHNSMEVDRVELSAFQYLEWKK